MKINNHSVGIEKDITAEQITEFLCRTFVTKIVVSSREDYLEYDGWFDYCRHKHGFATHINIVIISALHDISHDELAPLIAKEFQTRVIVDVPSGHPLASHPYYWQLFDADGQRYLISDREAEDDERDDDDEDRHGFLIYQIAPWPGESIYPGCGEEEDDD